MTSTSCHRRPRTPTSRTQRLGRNLSLSCHELSIRLSLHTLAQSSSCADIYSNNAANSLVKYSTFRCSQCAFDVCRLCYSPWLVIVGKRVQVDLTLNITERKTGGLSGGVGISAQGHAEGAVPGFIGSCSYSQRNLFGLNQKLTATVELGQVRHLSTSNLHTFVAPHAHALTATACVLQLDSLFRINHTDPWVGGDVHRTSRTINLQARSIVLPASVLWLSCCKCHWLPASKAADRASVSILKGPCAAMTGPQACRGK